LVKNEVFIAGGQIASSVMGFTYNPLLGIFAFCVFLLVNIFPFFFYYWLPVITMYEFLPNGVFAHQTSHRKPPSVKLVCTLDRIKSVYVFEDKANNSFDTIIQYGDKNIGIIYTNYSLAFDTEKKDTYIFK
jgi:hypothetical protein